MEPDLSKLVTEYGSEENIATRIREEMQARGWSQAKLAKEMAANGYPIHQSAISKIVSPPAGDGRRSVSVDEALGFAKTFGVGLSELLVPGYQLTSSQAIKLITEGHEAYKRMLTAEHQYESAAEKLVDRAAGDAEARNTFTDVFDAVVKDRTPEEISDSIQASFLTDVFDRLKERQESGHGE